MPGIHVLVTAAYAAYSPGNILRSALSSKGILLLKNLKLAIKKTTTEVAGEVFKRFIEIGLIRGGKKGNWNVNRYRHIMNSILVLETNNFYKDKLMKKQQSNIDLRLDYKRPPSFSHLEPHLRNF